MRAVAPDEKMARFSYKLKDGATGNLVGLCRALGHGIAAGQERISRELCCVSFEAVVPSG